MTHPLRAENLQPARACKQCILEFRHTASGRTNYFLAPVRLYVPRQSIVYDTNKIGAQQTSSKSLTDPSPGGPIIPLPVMEVARSYGFFLLQSSISLELTTIVTPSQQAIICPSKLVGMHTASIELLIFAEVVVEVVVIKVNGRPDTEGGI